MKEFLTQNLSWILPAIFISIFAIQAIWLLKKAKKIDREGIITEAVVSRITEHWDAESVSSSYTTYVEYKDETGTLRESPMTLTQKVEHDPGEKLLIRYIPGDDKLVREVK